MAVNNGSQSEPAVADLGNGKFIVTWSDNSGHDGGSSNDIRGQIFTTLDAAGDALTTPQRSGSDFRVNTDVTGSQYQPSVTSLNDGGFVIAWRDDSGSSGVDVYGQRFDATGAEQGDEFLINTYTGGSQYEPSIDAHGDGFVVTWRDDNGAADSRGG